VHYAGLVLPLMLDRKDKRGWQNQAPAVPTKYARLGRRIIKGRGRWICQLIQHGEASLWREPVGGGALRQRNLAQRRKRAYGRLADRILGQGNMIKTEKLSDRSLQKNFGRSVKVRAPGMLISQLRRTAAGAGGGMVEINPRKTALSQFAVRPHHRRIREAAARPADTRLRRWSDRTGAARSLQRLPGGLLRSRHSRQPPGQSDLAGCATTAATRDVEDRAIRERARLCLAPGPPGPRSGSRVEDTRDGRPSEAADAYPDASRARAAASLKHGSFRTLVLSGFSQEVQTAAVSLCVRNHRSADRRC
jgi:hypothetical protein